MRNLLYFILIVCMTNLVTAQNCFVSENIVSKIGNKRAINQDEKLVRLVFHFIQDDDGGFNFNENRTSLNGNKSGYDMVNEILFALNDVYQNSPLNIPNGNNIDVNYRNINFVSDAIYFHKNTHANNFNNRSYSIYNQYKVNPDNSIQIFIVSRGGGGSASTTSQTSLMKYSFVSFGYQRYLDWLDGADDYYNWITHPLFTAIGHEIFHLLGLNHTVRYPSGALFPASSNSDPDGCEDTPSPWEMFNIYGSNHHPACGWGTGADLNCSNNWMDYSGQHALSPCQILKMHQGLNLGLSSFRVCKYLNDDTFIHNQIGFPTKSIYGNNIFVNSDSLTLEENNELDFYFHTSVNIEPGFETAYGASFSTNKWNSCQL